MIYELTQDNFAEEIEKSDIPVLVDMYADWCKSCKNMTPIIDTLAEEQQGKIKVCKIDINSAPQVAARYNVDSLPTCILFDEGDVKTKVIGVRNKHELEEEIGI